MTVVLRNVFHLDDFGAEPTLRDDLEADMLSECAKLGAVDKVRPSVPCNSRKPGS